MGFWGEGGSCQKLPAHSEVAVCRHIFVMLFVLQMCVIGPSCAIEGLKSHPVIFQIINEGLRQNLFIILDFPCVLMRPLLQIGDGEL